MNRRERAVLVFLAACFLTGTGATVIRGWLRGRSPAADYVPVQDSAAVPATDAGGPLDINVASASALEGLPGIGPVLAGRIVDYRTLHGRFRSAGELMNVPGIGPKRFALLEGLVVAGPDSG